MAFESWAPDGSRLFQTQFMSYGLVASGNMVRLNSWYRWQLRSINLDPTDPGSYSQVGPYDVVHGFSVANSIAPIAFIFGEGMYAGSQTVNGVTTFYYIFSSPNTRIYIFDVMRDFALAAGMKCYADDAANTCTFNSKQVPLNIIGVSQCPPPPAPISNQYYGVPLAGGTKRFERLMANNEGSSYCVCRAPQTLDSNIAYGVATTFSRTIIQGRQDQIGTIGGVNLAYANYMGCFDGCWGTNGGVVWATTDAPRTQMITASVAVAGGYAGIPQDRYPQGLLINISSYPFPYSAY